MTGIKKGHLYCLVAGDKIGKSRITRKVYEIQDDLYMLVNNVSSFRTKDAINNCEWVDVYSGLDKDISRLKRLINRLEEAQKIVGRIVVE